MFSLANAEVCKTLQELISVQIDWTWNRIHQALYDREKEIVKKDSYMKFYDTSRLLYLVDDTSGVSLGAVDCYRQGMP